MVAYLSALRRILLPVLLVMKTTDSFAISNFKSSHPSNIYRTLSQALAANGDSLHNEDADDITQQSRDMIDQSEDTYRTQELSVPMELKKYRQWIDAETLLSKILALEEYPVYTQPDGRNTGDKAKRGDVPLSVGLSLHTLGDMLRLHSGKHMTHNRMSMSQTRLNRTG